MNKLLPHESAELHVSGEALYTDDIPELTNTLHCALGLSQRAHANIASIDLSAVRKAPGVVDVFTADDIPGTNDCGPIIADDPILADGLVQYLGQPVFAVIATSYEAARRAAPLAEITYDELPVVLTPKEARLKESYVVPPLHCKRGAPEKALSTSKNRLKGELNIGCLLYTSPSPRDS